LYVFVIVPLVVATGLWVGIHYGSYAAGGSDSYGYLSQAPLWVRGDLHVKQPWVADMSWPGRDWSFAPLGYRPSSPDGTLVPTYPPGLPMLMALFLAAFGANGPFYVVPILGAFALMGTYLLGFELTRSRAVGVGAALLLLASPPFLAHLMLPMTDAPMAAGWTLAMYFALRDPRPMPMVAGLMTAVMLLMRPNLTPALGGADGRVALALRARLKQLARRPTECCAIRGRRRSGRGNCGRRQHQALRIAAHVRLRGIVGRHVRAGARAAEPSRVLHVADSVANASGGIRSCTVVRP
jgi:hypothetical protein